MDKYDIIHALYRSLDRQSKTMDELSRDLGYGSDPGYDAILKLDERSNASNDPLSAKQYVLNNLDELAASILQLYGQELIIDYIMAEKWEDLAECLHVYLGDDTENGKKEEPAEDHANRTE